MQDDPQKPQDPAADPAPAVTPGETPNPAWAKDLRELYNSVVEEPLPANIMALLSQLDTKD